MQDWHSTCLGRRTLPRDLSAFEIEAFFNFTDAERRVIEVRRGTALKLALALQIGFLRMTGRLLEAVRMCHRHCGGIWVSNSASLRQTCIAAITTSAHRCSSTRKWPARRSAFTGYRRPAACVGAVLRGELTRTSDWQRLVAVCASLAYEHRLIVLRDRDLRTLIIKAIREREAGLARSIVEGVDPPLLRSGERL